MSLDIFNLVSPMFFVILTGFIFSRVIPFFKPEAGAILIKFSFYVALPALLLSTLTKTPLEKIFKVEYLLAFGGTTLLFFILTILLSKTVFKKSLAQSAILGSLSTLTNMGFIGLPLTLSLLGRDAVAPATLAIVMIVIFFYPLLLIMIDIDQSKISNFKDRLLHLTKSIFTNPIVLPAIIGTTLSSCDFKFPTLVDSYFGVLEVALTPCALFAIGIGIETDKIKGYLKEISLITIVKLFILPASTLYVCHFFKVDPMYTALAVISVAIPPAKSLYVIADQYNVLADEAAATISFATLLSILSLFGWIFLLAHLYPSIFLSI